MKFQKQVISLFSTLFLLNLVHAQEKDKPEEIILTPGPIVGNYNKNDLNEVYDETSVEIQCAGSTCISSSDNVLLDEGKVIISTEGTYILDGELNGQLNIAATKEDLIHLVLRNATISSDFGPAIYAEKCKKLIVTMEGQNTISDSTNYPEDAVIDETDEVGEEDENQETEKVKKSPNACIFVKNNLTFNGKGSIDVTANFNEGIRSKKNLKFVSGKINVVAKGNGIKGKASVSIKDGEINVDAGQTGIKATKDTDPEEGFVVIDGGKITVKAVKDAIHAETHLTINDGEIKVLGCEEGIEGQMIDITGGDIYVDASNDAINASLIGASNQVMFGGGFQFGNSNKNDKNDKNDKNNGQGSFQFGRNKDNDNGSTESGSKVPRSEDPIPPQDETEDLIPPQIETEDPIPPQIETEVVVVEKPTEVITPIETTSVGVTPIETTEVTKTKTTTSKKPSSTNIFSSYSSKNYKNDDNVYIRIVGGKVDVRVEGTDTDGIDSNGSLYLGGNSEVYSGVAYGGAFGHFSAFDSDGSKTIEANTTALITGSGKFPSFSGMSGGWGGWSGSGKSKSKNTTTTDNSEKSGNNTKEARQFGGMFGGSGLYDEPESVSCLQPYIRTVIDLQAEGAPIIVKDSEDNVIFERSPRVEYAIVFFTSPKLIEGEIYTLTAGDVTETLIAQVDTDRDLAAKNRNN